MVDCPICGKGVKEADINSHLDSSCQSFVDEPTPDTPASQHAKPSQVAGFFRTPSSKKLVTPAAVRSEQIIPDGSPKAWPPIDGAATLSVPSGNKRTASELETASPNSQINLSVDVATSEPPTQKHKPTSAFERAAPLAERMRPRTLDEVCGQELVGPSGVLRGLIETDRVPSMILWGGAGTGKTTIARVVAHMVGSRFVEINSTSSGVGECKKLFAEARREMGLTGRKTIIFCDEIHRFSKTQQDVFLGPVESGQVTLIGATTENPSFKVQNALLSRCRTFTLKKLEEEDIGDILRRALKVEGLSYGYKASLVDDELVKYLAAFAEGDARTALNLLELAMNLSTRPGATQEIIKSSLTKTLVYDRAGDQHYDTISAFHKSVRGSDADAALYYLARMLQSGEDPLYVARRMIVIASEDIGLASMEMLPLAVATHTAVSVVGLPEARINLAHCTCALALAPKSIRAYRGLNNAYAALAEPGVASLPIPIHLRNAPTRLMKELGYGKEYKYNPRYRDGVTKQEYLPERLADRRLLEDHDFGNEIDPDLEDEMSVVR